MKTGSSVRRALAATLVALVSVLVPTSAFADGPGFGVKGGFVHSSLSFNANDALDSQAGWMAGILFGGHAGAVDIGGELNYLVKRTQVAPTGAKVELRYLEVPLLIRFNFGSIHTSGVGGYVMIGPGIDFHVGDSVTGFAKLQTFEKFEINIIAAAGMEIMRIIIEARGMWGLRDVSLAPLIQDELHSRSFAILGGFRFK